MSRTKKDTPNGELVVQDGELFVKDSSGVLHHTSLHPARWTAVGVWIALFSVVVIWIVGSNRHQISQLREAKASVVQLEKTNCGLKKFLLNARNARLKTSYNEEGKQKKNDTDAAAGYQKLADGFTAVGEGCKLPPLPKAAG